MNENNAKRNIPVHIGLIPDGNRRWAAERNLSVAEGHRHGCQKVVDCCDWFFLRGVAYVSVYLFSSEHWSRDEGDIASMMGAAGETVTVALDDFIKKDYRVIISGRIDELPNELPQVFADICDKTKTNNSGTLNICFNYGGRTELIDAIIKIIRNGLTEEQIHEGIVKKYLYNPLVPDPNLLVHTGGGQRLENFLLWQSARSELIFLKKYWPDFEELDAVAVIDEYNNRQSRFGQEMH